MLSSFSERSAAFPLPLSLTVSDVNMFVYLQKIIPYSKIIGVYKRNTAIVFSNAIEIMTRKTKVLCFPLLYRFEFSKLIILLLNLVLLQFLYV